MVTLIIPKKITRRGELVLIPKKDLEKLIARAGNSVREKDVLRWSREVRLLKRVGKLPVLRSLRAL